MKPGRRPTQQQWPDPGPKPEAIWVPINRLSVDIRYQRSLEGRRSQALIQHIAANWSYKKAGTLGVSPSAFDNFALWDGQHRWAAAKLRGDIPELLCLSSDAPTVQEQAQLFVDANQDRVKVHMYALHHALVVAGNPERLTIDRVCRDADVEIARYPIPVSNLKPGVTLAVGTIKKVVKLRGEDIAVEALRVLRSAFSDVPGALRAHLIEGIATVLAVDAGAKADRIVTGLKDLGLRGIERRIQEVIMERGDAKAQALVSILRDMLATIPATPLRPTQPAPVAKLQPAKVPPQPALRPRPQGEDLLPAGKPNNVRKVSRADAAAAVDRFIATRGVTKCPTAAVADTRGVKLDPSDVAALERHKQEQIAAEEEKRNRRRAASKGTVA